MPTGYTYNIPDGISPRQFMLQCVRAMGVLVEMRDSPQGAPIPKELKADEHHLKALINEKGELQKLLSMSGDEIRKICDQNHLDLVASQKKRREEESKTLEAYQRMIESISSWTPPTPEHENFKKFMLDQLTDSVRFSASLQEELQKVTPQEWLRDQLLAVQWRVDYHTKCWESEQSRTAERNAWLKAFWESLPPEIETPKVGASA